MNKRKILIFLFIITIFINAYANSIIGDVDGNGTVGTNDYILVRKHILSNPKLTGEELKRADVNSDGNINTADYIMIRKIILKIITPTAKPTQTDTTKPTITSCKAKVSSGNKTTYTVTATDASGIKKYVHNGKTYTTNVFTVTKDVQNDVVRVYDNSDNYKDVTCTYDQISSSGKTIVDSYNSDTLKYWIEKPANNYRITHIWVKNAYNQLKTSISSKNCGLETAKTILNKTINDNSYSKKGMIAINSSSFILANKTSDDYWKYQGYSSCKHYARSPLIINNSNVLRDFTIYELPSNLYPLYGLKNNGYLNSYTFKGGSTSYIENNKEVVQQVKNDGIKYTFSFSPKLLENYENLVVSKTTSSYTEKNVRQALCQIDYNNYVIVSSYPSASDSNNISQKDRDNGLSHKRMAEIMESLNCRTGYNLDGGGSLNFYYKKNTSTIYNLRKSSRLIFDMLYFVE